MPSLIRSVRQAAFRIRPGNWPKKSVIALHFHFTAERICREGRSATTSGGSPSAARAGRALGFRQPCADSLGIFGLDTPSRSGIGTRDSLTPRRVPKARGVGAHDQNNGYSKHMCGITGMWSMRAHTTCVERVLLMTAALEHRGPDDSGVHALPDGGPVLGHRRLSILDLSALGHQPMQSQCGRNWVVYNGEIYNFREIRQELERLHHRFLSDSDTEVILAAYAQWGLTAVSRFRGMFAFALWDGGAKRLHLCRDRLGVKPLYYARTQQLLAFASEPKALHCGPRPTM